MTSASDLIDELVKEAREDIRREILFVESTICGEIAKAKHDLKGQSLLDALHDKLVEHFAPLIAAAMDAKGIEAAIVAARKKLGKGVLAKVGPHGYIHGWILVGGPEIGHDVEHPEHGRGVVAEVHGDSATISFERAGRKDVEVKWQRGGTRLERKPRADEPTPPTREAPPHAGWKKLSDVEAIEHEFDKMVRQGVSPATARHSAERGYLMYPKGYKEVYLFQDGTEVQIDISKSKTTAAKKREILDAVAEMKVTYPNKQMSVALVNTQVGHAFSKNAFGVTRRGSGHIILMPVVVKPGGQETFENSIKTGFFAPAGRGKSVTRYTIVHEWGHTLDQPKGTPRRHETERILKESLPVSIYGEDGLDKNPPDYAEAYAEAFAEWHLSGGMTPSPVAQALAKSEGWR